MRGAAASCAAASCASCGESPTEASDPSLLNDADVPSVPVFAVCFAVDLGKGDDAVASTGSAGV